MQNVVMKVVCFYLFLAHCGSLDLRLSYISFSAALSFPTEEKKQARGLWLCGSGDGQILGIFAVTSFEVGGISRCM